MNREDQEDETAEGRKLQPSQNYTIKTLCIRRGREIENPPAPRPETSKRERQKKGAKR